jgi:hypothetical protein
MLRTVMAIALIASLLGCVGEPEVQRVDLAAHPEKAVLAALTKIKATEAQKIAVLNAYDSRNAHLVKLNKTSKLIIAQWYQLKRTAPDYLEQVDALAEQWAQVNSDEMKARAAYEHDVAVNLSPEQWSGWQDFMASAAAARRRAELYGEDGLGIQRRQ